VGEEGANVKIILKGGKRRHNFTGNSKHVLKTFLNEDG
jgi:hypothetical protein